MLTHHRPAAAAGAPDASKHTRTLTHTRASAHTFRSRPRARAPARVDVRRFGATSTHTRLTCVRERLEAPLASGRPRHKRKFHRCSFAGTLPPVIARIVRTLAHSRVSAMPQRCYNTVLGVHLARLSSPRTPTKSYVYCSGWWMVDAACMRLGWRGALGCVACPLRVFSVPRFYSSRIVARIGAHIWHVIKYAHTIREANKIPAAATNHHQQYHHSHQSTARARATAAYKWCELTAATQRRRRYDIISDITVTDCCAFAGSLSPSFVATHSRG